jgi:hypothetical protein
MGMVKRPRAADSNVLRRRLAGAGGAGVPALNQASLSLSQ